MTANAVCQSIHNFPSDSRAYCEASVMISERNQSVSRKRANNTFRDLQVLI